MDDITQKLNQILANQAWAEEVLKAVAKKILEIQVAVSGNPEAGPHSAAASAFSAAEAARNAIAELWPRPPS